MPLYTYKCPQCGFFEETRELNDSLTPCPQCGTLARREPYSGVPYSNTETGGDFLPGKPWKASGHE